jgi:hypothetical protein
MLRVVSDFPGGPHDQPPNLVIQTFEQHVERAEAAKRGLPERDLKSFQNLDINALLSGIATRVTDPNAVFGTPADRYDLPAVAGQITRGLPMVALGKKVVLRCSRALHDFVCNDGEDPALRAKLTQALIGRDVSAISIITAALTFTGVAPSIAILVATVINQVLFVPTIQELCASWDARLSQGIEREQSKIAQKQ